MRYILNIYKALVEIKLLIIMNVSKVGKFLGKGLWYTK